jgi:hypothetical protein
LRSQDKAIAPGKALDDDEFQDWLRRKDAIAAQQRLELQTSMTETQNYLQKTFVERNLRCIELRELLSRQGIRAKYYIRSAERSTA